MNSSNDGQKRVKKSRNTSRISGSILLVVVIVMMVISWLLDLPVVENQIIKPLLEDVLRPINQYFLQPLLFVIVGVVYISIGSSFVVDNDSGNGNGCAA